ncbi:LysR family transcriptional regulator [Thioclava electrotropha]|uniref:LysR family transcriptional regulator n=1 Tax=Thioclava electrotropha TaxID=1549850 RepID=A0ABX6YT66_9RHOB|nr:LysR family transcriptional regulator [Thioclava electrotropha]QPZ91026.1 LysR family transcriptional regulator [Thioclava electrotropha]
MRREDIADISAFVMVAEAGSFTKAARQLGITQSALSQIVRRLEERLDVRLLARTTRSVAPTAAGERLVARMAPMLRDLETGLTELIETRDRPGGHIRITSVEHAARAYVLPALARLLSDYPEITVEVIVDYGLVDVVADRFDAGVRLGAQVEKDMIAVRISPDIPMAVVATPEHISAHGRPERPESLVENRCICLRLPSSETLYSWRFVAADRETQVRVSGPVISNTAELMHKAAREGLGFAMLPADMVAEDLQEGRLEQVLSDVTAPLPGYHLYYPNRRHASPAFRLLVDALRYRA